ncbi:MAG: hypothetical protein LBQ88_18160 [Treponema sp.]|nr:hypothetical protein [Treponema sp.]
MPTSSIFKSEIWFKISAFPNFLTSSYIERIFVKAVSNISDIFFIGRESIMFYKIEMQRIKDSLAQSEEALRASEAKLQAAYRAAQDSAVWLTFPAPS